MKYFHGERKETKYFEGWYLKHQKDDQIISFIPAMHIDEKGEKSASLQVITASKSYVIEYPAETFWAEKKRFVCHIGRNVFSENGCTIDIRTKELSVKGSLQYGQFVSPKSNVMGPFKIVPKMQCNHGVLSLTHPIRGMLKVNKETINFTGGTGYIEKDWGTSFPTSYSWTQCSWKDKGPACLMLSVATIPILRWSFRGCIATIYYRGEEYRIATYLGAKIKRNADGVIAIRQGQYRLHVKLENQGKCPLRAPTKGAMKRVIKESLACNVRYRFYKGKELVFDMKNRYGSMEHQA